MVHDYSSAGVTVFSNYTDQHAYLKLKKGDNEERIICTKRSGYTSVIRVRLLADNGTLTSDVELTSSENHATLQELGISILDLDNKDSKSLWQNFEVILKNITLSLTVQCGAKNGNDLKFYDRVVVIQASELLPTTCHRDSGTPFISTTSTLSVMLFIGMIVGN